VLEPHAIFDAHAVFDAVCAVLFEEIAIADKSADTSFEEIAIAKSADKSAEIADLDESAELGHALDGIAPERLGLIVPER